MSSENRLGSSSTSSWWKVVELGLVIDISIPTPGVKISPQLNLFYQLYYNMLINILLLDQIVHFIDACKQFRQKSRSDITW